MPEALYAPLPERELFEAWAAPILGDNPTWKESADCELAWQAWQARADATCSLRGGQQGTAQPPAHFPPREAFIWTLGFRAGKESS